MSINIIPIICTGLVLVLHLPCKCLGDEVLLQDSAIGEADHHRHPGEGSSMSSYETWVCSIIASCVVGLSGVVPVIFIPIETGLKMNNAKGGTRYLRLLLSFAVGSLLGDVFLHLLPEAWDRQKNLASQGSASLVTLGLSVLMGMFSFIVLEMIFTATQPEKKNSSPKELSMNNFSEDCYDKVTVGSSSNGRVAVGNDRIESNIACYQRKSQPNGHHIIVSSSQNGSATKLKATKSKTAKAAVTPIHIAGYLNLMANSIDNFTHGLAVAASFLVSCKMGVLTTFAILIHEIPHEIGDFAILLKSGFHPLTAAKAQISTATIGVAGVIVALSAESIDRVGVCTSYILPFTAGGFLNIALVNVLPDLLKENDPWESMKQFVCLCIGIGVMAFVSFLS